MTKPDQSSANDDVVFICGALRSGTTLLRIMVNDHPALQNPGEMDFLFECPGEGERQSAYDAYFRELSHNRVFSKLGLKIDPALRSRALIRDFVAQLQKPGQRLSINIHRHFDRIPEFFPNARYVHLLRDPRDVAKSSIGMGWAGNVFYGVNHWIASERDFERLAAKVPPTRVHRMRNEDLVRSPERELKALCAFFGVAYDPAMLDYPSHTTYGPPDPTLVEQWRRNMSARDLGLVEGKLGSMLADRGYAASGARLETPGPGARALLRLEDRIGRWRFLARHNGVTLTLADMLAQRLPLQPFKDYTRRLKGRQALKRLK
jgi:hypothetical protein